MDTPSRNQIISNGVRTPKQTRRFRTSPPIFTLILTISIISIILTTSIIELSRYSIWPFFASFLLSFTNLIFAHIILSIPIIYGGLLTHTTYIIKSIFSPDKPIRKIQKNNPNVYTYDDRYDTHTHIHKDELKKHTQPSLTASLDRFDMEKILHTHPQFRFRSSSFTHLPPFHRPSPKLTHIVNNTPSPLVISQIVNSPNKSAHFSNEHIHTHLNYEKSLWANDDEERFPERVEIIGTNEKIMEWLNNLRRYFIYLLVSPTSLVAGFIQTLGWCSIWLWGTSYLHRETDDRMLKDWKFDRIPNWYWFVEPMFLWTMSFDYCLGAILTTNVLRHIISVSSLIDLLTLPITHLILDRVVSIPNIEHFHWLLLLGSIRFLKLLRCEQIFSKAQLNFSPVKLRIYSITVSVLAIALTYAGIMFILESPITGIGVDPFSSMFDYFYFSIVTISTVSYGDYSPFTKAGRIITVFVIVLTFAYVIGEVKKLSTALQQPNPSMGSMPNFGEDYVCIIGTVQPSQLALLCRTIAHTFPDSVSSVVVITPFVISRFKNVREATIHKSSLKVFIRASESKYYFPAIIKKLMGNCKATFVCCDVRPANDNTSLKGIDSIEAEEDQLTLTRFMGLLGLGNRSKNITVQLIHEHRKSLVKQMGAKNALSLTEIKMKLIGKSCTDCPGFVTLVGNWFYTPTKQQANFQFWSNPQMEAYAHGFKYQIYRIKIPACFKGMKFLSLVQLLLKNFNVYLIGLIDLQNRIYLNPVQFPIGSDLMSSMGVILAPSVRVVNKISNLPKSAYQPYSGNTTETIEKESPPLKFAQNPLYHPHKQSSKSSNMNSKTFNILANTNRKRLPSGIYEVQNVNEAKSGIFEDKNRQIILACGWPLGLDVFLRTICYSCSCNVIILCPSYPKTILRNELENFNLSCAYISGSALRTSDLLKAGVLECNGIAIFSSSHTHWRSDLSVAKLDIQSVLVLNTVRAILVAENANFEQTDSTHTDFPIISTDDIHNQNKSEFLDNIPQQKPFVITELRDGAFLEYLGQTSQGIGCLTEDVQDAYNWWETLGTYTTTREFASGRVFVEELLYGLMAFESSLSDYAIDVGIVDNLIMGNQLTHKLQDDELLNGYKQKCYKNTQKPKKLNGGLKLLSIPAMFTGLLFEDLFWHLMEFSQQLAIGLYRKNNSLDENIEDGKFIDLPAVISCPIRNLKLRNGDMVYVILPDFTNPYLPT